jgi:uncharacterized protein YbcV (DUF1398 family)
MTPEQQATARACLAAAHDDSMAFPQIVGALIAAGFEGYAIDYRRGTATYYLPDGDSLELASARGRVAPRFDQPGVQTAIREAQANGPGYTYDGFCRKVVAAGCAGYITSFSGRRVVYFGRDAELHVEYFPDAPN